MIQKTLSLIKFSQILSYCDILIECEVHTLINLSKKKQADSSLSKNRVPISLTTNDVTIKSHEQGLITKEYIAMHTN